MGACARPGETVLIHGASGAVGTAAVQIARALGTVVVGTAGTKDGMDVVTRCGAHHVFNHNHKSYEKKMVEHIGGVGFDVIIEHLANINLGHDVQMLKEGESWRLRPNDPQRISQLFLSQVLALWLWDAVAQSTLTLAI